jgi:ring-1,2-phenylacetyl-CoA epoxidase subunit PaaA
LKGNGPCNAERIAARRNAHAAGAWVREAASAYAAKHGGAAASTTAASPTAVKLSATA